MKDFSLLAKALDLDIPEDEVAQIAAPLRALDQAFQPLTRCLTPDMEPGPVFRADQETR